MRMDGLLVEKIAGDRDDVFAVIGIFRELDGFALKFAAAQLDGVRKVSDLNARIVVVELAGNLPALGAEKIGKHVAQSALASMAQVQGAGGIRRNVLEKHRFPFMLAVRAVSLALTKHFADDRHAGILRNANVDEARSGDLDRVYRLGKGRISLHGGDKLLGDCTGIFLQATGQLQSAGAGDVAVRRILRALKRHRGVFGAEFGESSGDELLNGFFLIVEHGRERASKYCGR